MLHILLKSKLLDNEVKIEWDMSVPTGVTVLLLCKDGKSYYDDQVIKVSEGKCAKQIGTFKYSTKAGFDKTVPIVSILNKY